MTRRIFNAIILVAVTVLILSFLIIMDVLYGSFTAEQTAQLHSELEIAAHGAEQGGVEWLEGLEPDNYRLTLVDPTGDVLFDSRADAAKMENHADREEISEALLTGSGESERISATLTGKTFYQAVRLEDGRVLRIATVKNSVLTLVMGMLTPVLIVLTAAIILSAVLAHRLAKRIVQPLNDIDLENPLDNDVYEELSPLLGRIAQQRREIEKQLRSLKRRQDEFAAITGSMNEGLVLLNEDRTVLGINPAAQALFHADASCTGKDFLSIDRDRSIQRSVEEAEAQGRGETVIERNGRQYQIDTSRIQSGGRTAGTVLLAFDITEKAQAERRRREFTANVSHELKTPLQSIMGSAELMQNGLVKPEDMPRFTARIRSEAARLVTLIDDIIRLSQLDEGGELPMERVELLTVAKDVTMQLEEAAREKGVELTVSGDAAQVYGVRRLLHEIAYNLVENAIKYNREGGSVKVSTETKEGYSLLTVSDTGIGIPEEHADRVFERFYRVDKSHSRATGGTGLGLSIVKHAVETLCGRIQLVSRVGEGTVITVSIPTAGET